MKRGFVVAAIAVVVGSGLAGTARAEGGGLRWAPCPENAEVECAALVVPIDWARPGLGSIEVEVARRRATGPERIGTLMYLPGGPGGSGVSALTAGQVLTDNVARRFDVVSFDPRGTNRSHAVVCPVDALAEQPNFVPDTGATLEGVRTAARRLGDACRERTGPLIDHVDSASVARDMDALRAALGERELTFYGISYGTLTGQMYAERYPGRVRAMVLDSVFDHSLSTRGFLVTEARAAEDSFGEFAAWCERTPSCGFHGEDVGAVYGALYERALRGELHMPGDPEVPLGPLDLIQQTVGRLYGPAWTDLVTFLQTLRSQEPAAASASDVVEFPLASFCGDHDFRFSSQRDWANAWRTMNRTAPTVRGHFAWPIVSLCEQWPARTGNPQHRTDVDDAPPILLMNSRYDPATPHEWAASVARQLDDSVLLTYEGWGHRTYDRSPCTLDAFHRYLIDGVTPSDGASCAAVEPPTALSAQLNTSTGW